MEWTTESTGSSRPGLRLARATSPWVSWLACGAGVVFAAILFVRHIRGDDSYVGIAGLMPAAIALVMAGAVLAAVSALDMADPSKVRTTIIAKMRAATLRVIAVVMLAGSCFVLLNLIELVIDHRVTNRNGASDWLAFAERLASAAVGLLFWSAADGGGPTTGRQGAIEHGVTHRRWVQDPPVTAASRAVRRTVLAGCVAFIPYLGVHGAHAAGLAPSLDVLYEKDGIFPGPPAVGWLLFVVLIIGPAVFLAQGLIRPWGMVFPRWILVIGGRRVPRLLPLIPAWLVAPTLVLYGFGSIVYVVRIGADLVGLGGAASLAFSCYGTALVVAALSYQQRTRPVPSDEGVTLPT